MQIPIPDAWWQGDPAEKYWVEIRKVPGIGLYLKCDLRNRAGHRSPWYETVDEVRVGDVVYHWQATHSRFVGVSTVASPVRIHAGERRVGLQGFIPLVGEVDLAAVRSCSPRIRQIRRGLETRHPQKPLYLPFQNRSDGLRMMSNYFAKLPKSVVTLLFGVGGMAASGASAPPRHHGPAVQGRPPGTPRQSYLEPFQPKADSNYVANVRGGPQVRGRRHEDLVNGFSSWLENQGLTPGRNQAVDIGLDDPPVIVEAEIINRWAHSVREAVGQLYEYRYFKVAHPESELVFLASEPVPKAWRSYLERDRGIGVAWRTSNGGFKLSRKTRSMLGLN